MAMENLLSGRFGVAARSFKIRGRIKHACRLTLQALLPPLWYFRAVDVLLPFFYPERAGGGGRSVAWRDGAYLLSFGDGATIWFAHPNRYGRYAWPDGSRRVFDIMLRKYQDTKLRLRPGDVVLEAGANIGEFTMAAAGIAAAVYAFEPDRLVLAALRHNTAGLTNVTVRAAGLGATSGTAAFYLATAQADSSVVPPPRFTHAERVELVTIADFMAAAGIQKIDFLKLEAEGFEPEILAGCGKRLADIARIAIDCSPERGGKAPFVECEAILRPAGFVTWRRPAQGELPAMLFAMRGNDTM